MAPIRTTGATNAVFLVYFAWTVVRRITHTVWGEIGDQNKEAVLRGTLARRLAFDLAH